MKDTDEKYWKLCEEISNNFNLLPKDERIKISVYATRAQLFTLCRLKESLKRDLTPRAIEEIDRWMHNTNEYLETLLKVNEEVNK